MGEQLNENEFRMMDFSVDLDRGTSSTFFRDSTKHDLALELFFEKTGRDYSRFNYLGEWHTHPSFSVTPSTQDISSMQDLVSPPGDVYFAFLLITKLKWIWHMESSVNLFIRDDHPRSVRVVYEKNNKNFRG